MKKKAYVLKISLAGIVPEIWRRFVVPADITIDRLHDVIQIVMGWQDYHLHQFTISGRRYTAQQVISRLESPRDKRMPSLELLDRVAKALNKKLVISLQS